MLEKIKSKISPDNGTLQKAKLVYRGGSMDCQFNPATLTISKSVNWQSVTHTNAEVKSQPDQNAPRLIFGGGVSATFNLSLLFDTTSLDSQDVRGFTNQLLKLTLKGAGDPSRKDENPPRVQFIWGRLMLFQAYITSVEISYTLFLPSGVPVRARVNAGFIQAFDEDGSLAAQNPTSRTDPRSLKRVQQGDRLDFLAFKEYGDPTQWREIALANDLDDPAALRSGQMLIMPPRK